MRILVSEYVCGGGWPESRIPATLAAEGRAMLTALCADLSRLAGISVLTTWDCRLGSCPLTNSKSLQVSTACSPQHEAELLNELAETADRALIVAPELDGVLETRCRHFLKRGLRLLNCSPEAIHICGDKWLFYELCQQHDWPTIPTVAEFPSSMPWQHCVIKRRDGAGSSEMQLVSHPAAWDEFLSSGNCSKFVAQPLVPGESLSIAGIYDAGELRQLFPVGIQHVVPDHRFQYRGGRIPAGNDRDVRPVIAHLMHLIGDAIPGLQGYVGVDLLLPEQAATPLVVEVNPRLTTSYVGYRMLTENNLATYIVDTRHSPGLQFGGSVVFSADGRLIERSL